MSYIIGIDPGSSFLGLAIMNVDLYTGTIHAIETHTITPATVYQGMQYVGGRASDLDSSGRTNLIAPQVAYYLRLYQPVAVAIETPFYNRRFPGAFAVLQHQLTTLCNNVIIPTLPYVDIHGYAPMVIKKAVGAKVRGGKEAVRLAVADLGLDAFVNNYHSISEHEVDAIAAAYCSMIGYN